MGHQPGKPSTESAKTSAGSPYFDATGNGAQMLGRWYIIDGALKPAENYLIHKLRQRFNAQAGEMVDLCADGKLVRVTVEVFDEGDVDARADA